MKLKQLFCKHKKVTPTIRTGGYGFGSLNGETVYHICDNCGKIVKEEFLSNEVFYARYK